MSEIQFSCIYFTELISFVRSAYELGKVCSSGQSNWAKLAVEERKRERVDKWARNLDPFVVFLIDERACGKRCPRQAGHSMCLTCKHSPPLFFYLNHSYFVPLSLCYWVVLLFLNFLRACCGSIIINEK